MPRPALDLIGTTSGKLSITGKASRASYWVCQCSCGRTVEVRATRLINKQTMSCGCSRIKHGHTVGGKPSSTYESWRAMKARCDNPAIASHGGRGIKYDPRWKDYSVFLDEWVSVRSVRLWRGRALKGTIAKETALGPVS